MASDYDATRHFQGVLSHVSWSDIVTVLAITAWGSKRVGGAGRDRPKSRSAASDRPTRGPPQASRLDRVEKFLAGSAPACWSRSLRRVGRQVLWSESAAQRGFLVPAGSAPLPAQSSGTGAGTWDCQDRPARPMSTTRAHEGGAPGT